MRRFILVVLLVGAGYLPASAQNGCGATRNWTDPLCQTIGAGALDPKWTVISRHGEYLQSENECNIPSAVAVTGGNLAITTSRTAYTCGNWAYSAGAWGTDTSPASTPYTSGDVQWNSFQFKYGTVVIRQKLPAQNTRLWVGEWLLSVNCRTTNKYTGETPAAGPAPDGSCPSLGTAGYQEIDLLETKVNESQWGNTWIIKNATPGNGGVRFFSQDPLDTNWHTFATNWTASGVSYTIDGAGTGISYSSTYSPDSDMFLILQTQTTTVSGGTDPNDAYLPAQLLIDYVKVCNASLTSAQCEAAAWNNSAVIFYDDFAAADAVPPVTSLTAPTGGIVSGTVTVAANCTDDVAVAGVTFLYSGTTIGAEDTGAPYSISWNTATAPDGAYQLTARCRDTSNNTTTSAPVVVTVANAMTPGVVRVCH